MVNMTAGNLTLRDHEPIPLNAFQRPRAPDGLLQKTQADGLCSQAAMLDIKNDDREYFASSPGHTPSRVDRRRRGMLNWSPTFDLGQSFARP
jgi:hypothetical protein